jgi:hypothetical protein
MRDIWTWALILAVQVVLYVRVVRPRFLEQVAVFREVIALISDLIIPVR